MIFRFYYVYYCCNWYVCIGTLAHHNNSNRKPKKIMTERAINCFKMLLNLFIEKTCVIATTLAERPVATARQIRK